jgi:hypothetical protein
MHWIDKVIDAFEKDRAASKAMLEHDGSDWPHHIVYSNRQGQGIYYAATWKEHENDIRQIISADPASSYVDAKGHYTIALDPAHRSNAAKAIEQLRSAPRSFRAEDTPPELIEALANADYSHLESVPISGGFGARVRTIADVRPHGENLSIVTVAGHEVVANLKSDGSFRWRAGELCVYVPEGAIIPDDVLKERGYWDEEKDRGMLEGKKRNRVKMRRMAGHESRGLIFKVVRPEGNWPAVDIWAVTRGNEQKIADVGDDVAEFLGIIEHVAG